MGLFDKLKEAVGNAIESGINGPMNENEKKYYDIILNLLLSVPHLQKEHIQKFIEVKYNENCDEATLCKVLEKFETVTEPKTKETWYQLTSTQSSRASYKDGGLSWFNKDEVYEICYADFREEMRSKFKDIYKVVKSTPSKRVLEQGISKITESLPGHHSGYPHLTMTAKIICEELLAALLDGDSLMKEIAVDMALSHLAYTYEKSGDHEYIPLLYAFALRAYHYDNSGKDAGEYNSITETECYDVVSLSAHYKKVLESNPFEKEGIIRNAAEYILKSKIMLASYEFQWDYWAVQNNKFVDAACFFAWEKISTECQETADNVEDIALIIHAYLKNNVAD